MSLDFETAVQLAAFAIAIAVLYLGLLGDSL